MKRETKAGVSTQKGIFGSKAATARRAWRTARSVREASPGCRCEVPQTGRDRETESGLVAAGAGRGGWEGRAGPASGHRSAAGSKKLPQRAHGTGAPQAGDKAWGWVLRMSCEPSARLSAGCPVCFLLSRRARGKVTAAPPENGVRVRDTARTATTCDAGQRFLSSRALFMPTRSW